MAKASDNVFPRLLISEGGSTATPAASQVTVYAKADGLLYSKDDAGVETLVSGGAGGGGSGSLLAVQAYVAGSDAAVGTTGSTTLVDVDATNAAITFTAPASGNVVVHLDGGESSSASTFFWGLRESTTIIASASMGIGHAGAVTRNHVAFYLTGLSGSHTYKWAYAILSGTTGVYSGPTAYGKIVMTVEAAP